MHSTSAIGEGGPVGASVAMLVADVALETLLKQVLVDQGIKVPDRADVHELTKALIQSKPQLASVPELQIARRMRSARNPVQHAGFAPNEATASAHLRDAEAFADMITREFYGTELAQISVAALIQEPNLRGALEAAAASAHGGDLDSACIQLAAAFGLLFARCGYWVRRVMGVTDVEERFTSGRAHPAVLSVFGAEGVTPNTDEHQTWREITLVSLGIPLPDLLSLKGVEMYAEEVLRARKDGTSVSAEPPSVGAIRHAIDVLARHVWRLETAQPALVESSQHQPTG
ncbi:HEPN domain-containing protein [Anaeromyxobacter sp. PSR-1]|uniref:HEPN domain-containing protein n=1 Tax=Anaeromyxobacter sp. PSR-1 TaxID=1300915 RepID=UPI001364C41E|nr:HEPN domain-containing protein [Anaeromyxobacter sp. PSR-1]